MATYRPIFLASDVIFNAETDAKNIQLIVDGLIAKGIKANGYPNTGADSHINVLTDKAVESNALIVDVYGGMDPGCIREKQNPWYKQILGNRRDAIVYIFSHKGMPLITGLPYLDRDKTDNYDASWFKGIAHPDEYLAVGGVGYIEDVTVAKNLTEIVDFLATQAALVPISLTQTQVQDGVNRVNSYYKEYNKLPKIVSYSTEALSFSDFTRLVIHYGLNYDFLQYDAPDSLNPPATEVKK